MESLTNFPLTSLPPEMLTLVFSHLTWKERLNACLVCKDWLQLINRKTLLQDIKVYLRSNNSINLFMSMTRNFINFRFCRITFDNSFLHFFRRFSPFIEYIETTKCDINQLCPLNEVSFNNLTKLGLDLSGDWWSLFPALPKVSQLTIFNTCHISDYGLSVLQMSMKNLKFLDIAQNVECNPEVYMKFYAEGLTHETNPSSEILSFPAIKRFISERASTLSDLKMNDISAPALKELSCIKNLNLTRFHLLHFSGECGDSFINFFKTQHNLKELFLFADLDYNTTDALVNFLPNIEYLNILRCSMTDKSFIATCKLEKLKKVYIFFCKGTSSEGRREAISKLNPIQRECMKFSERDSDSFYFGFSIFETSRDTFDQF